MALRAIGILFLMLMLIYACDYLSVRIPAPAARQVFGSVQVRTEYAVRQKDKKLEFYFDPPTNEACVNSLFPHFDARPCWWLKRHANKLLVM